MIIDITLLFIFLVGAGALWFKVTQKIPELIAIPDQVITERLHEDSAQVRLFILHLKIFFKEARYKDVFLKIVGRALYKLHIAVLRTDNFVVRLLQKIKTAGAFNGNGNTNGDYWKQLQESVSNPETSQNPRIQEVRKKRV
jgi:hypothetical protein